MATNKEIIDALLNDKILNDAEHQFKDDDGNPIKMDSFASFFSDKKSLPKDSELRAMYNEQLKNHVNEEEFKPKKIKARTDYNFELNDSFINGKNSNKKFNNNFMLIAFNRAYRSDDIDRSSWNMFHDVSEKNDFNMLKLRLALNSNDEMFDGCYITDVLKSVVDSDSGHVNDYFFVDKSGKRDFGNSSTKELDETRAKRYVAINSKLSKDKKNHVQVYADEDEALKDVNKNKEIYKKSVLILIRELQIINPRNVIILGQSGAGQLIKNMIKLGQFDNYPDLKEKLSNAIVITHYSSVSGYISWYNKEQPNLQKQIAEREANK